MYRSLGTYRYTCYTNSLLVTANPLDKQCMQYILTGSVDHASRLCKAGCLTDPTCPFCMSSPETAEHIFWECPRWQHIRDTFTVLQLLFSRLGTIWPSCYLLYIAVGFLAITISVLTCCMRVILHMMFLYSLIQNQTLLPFEQYIKMVPQKSLTFYFQGVWRGECIFPSNTFPCIWLLYRIVYKSTRFRIKCLKHQFSNFCPLCL